MTIVCHPADAIDHAGGTLCLHAERGDEVSVVVYGNVLIDITSVVD